MKKISQKNARKNKVIVWSLFFLVLIILASVIVYQIIKDNQLRSKSPSLAESTQNIENKIENPNVPESKTINNEDGTKEDAAAGYTPKTPETITYSAKSANFYRIRVNIDQFLKLPGTCKLTVLSTGKVVYTDSVSVVSNPSSGTCEGFDIPLTRLTSGDYDLKIEINANQKTGIIEGRATI